MAPQTSTQKLWHDLEIGDSEKYKEERFSM